MKKRLAQWLRALADWLDPQARIVVNEGVSFSIIGRGGGAGGGNLKNTQEQ